ncbi:MAG: hypothetical protein COY42_05345 [Armatimonadetes bacterium CG_4_10_14_0_8_um_filter_66_14]|nr:MAG: hypothetical protein COZ05_03415 [Armatimonadetes bacterium CG_4_10_14_3_um_filter_59_10]PIZ48905.1 MAG: hypothetical protein COY42_05345 [Armatimonadetes bacterium CG_4_10_14_0_8_um_filter_66_14]PJB63799.1 MAG: hypothetical protein CO096_21040 [Armatimonadetes bacterium CG_4_9_14_3_um_filter_66_14]
MIVAWGCAVPPPPPPLPPPPPSLGGGAPPPPQLTKAPTATLAATAQANHFLTPRQVFSRIPISPFIGPQRPAPTRAGSRRGPQ